MGLTTLREGDHRGGLAAATVAPEVAAAPCGLVLTGIPFRTCGVSKLDHAADPSSQERAAARCECLRLLRLLRLCTSLERQRSGPSRASKKPLVKGMIEF